jgi:hypothetical protein
VRHKSTKTGVSVSFTGAWEFEPVSGTGSARLGNDGLLARDDQDR